MPANFPGFLTTRDGLDEKVVITHDVEIVLGSDGRPEQVYNFLDYAFPGVVGANELRARVSWGDREVYVTGAGLEPGTEAARLIVDYFSKRLFAVIHYLSPDPTKNDPVTGYKIFWSAAEVGR